MTDTSPTTTVAVQRVQPAPGRFRYREWSQLFRDSYEPALVAGASVLDVGSGRRPTIAPEDRPVGVRYVGLDLSATELGAAPAGSYDETHVASVETFLPELEGRFDLIVSWQVLEHVRDMAATLKAICRYLKPGGVMALEFTGKWSVPGVLGRILPRRIGLWGLVHIVGRKREEIFPAYFDQCSASELRRLLADAKDVRIVPRFGGGARYTRWFLPLHWSIDRFQDLMIRRHRDDLASYYLVVATRRPEATTEPVAAAVSL